MIFNIAGAYLAIVTAAVLFCRNFTTAAYCCQQKRSSSTVDRNWWLNEIGTLDELHLNFLKNAILSELRISDVPTDANRWRRTRSVAALLDRTDQGLVAASDERGDEVESTRRYSLKFVGLQYTKPPNKKRRTHHHRNNKQHNKGCTAHYEFKAKLAAVNAADRYTYETSLASADLLLPTTFVVDDDGDDYIFVLHASSVNNNHSSSMTLDLDADAGQQQQSRRVVDVGAFLRKFWSTRDGVNVALTRRRCRVNASASKLPNDMTVDGDAPILRLEVSEKKIRRRVLSKRQVVSGSINQRRQQRQDMIIDCEQQWDAAFLRNISSETYENLMPCCRRKVRVDFSELGWDQWVVAPQTFDSFYCIGRCSFFGGFASPDTEGASFYTELMNLQRRARSLGVSPCCSPVKFSPLTITVLTGDNEEMTQTLEDVVVKQCGCM